MTITIQFLPILQEDKLVLLAQVRFGLLDLVPQLDNTMIALFYWSICTMQPIAWSWYRSRAQCSNLFLSGCRCTTKGFAHMLISCVIASSRTLNIV